MLSDVEVKHIMFSIERSEDMLSYKVDGVSMYYLLRFQLETDLRMDVIADTPHSGTSILSRVFKRLNHEIKVYQKRRKLRAVIKQFDRPGDSLKSPLMFVSTSSYVNAQGVAIHLIDLVEYYHAKGHAINFVQRKNFSAKNFPQRSTYYHRYLSLDFNYTDNFASSVYADLQAFLKLISQKTNVDYSSRIDIYYASLIHVIGEANQLVQHIIDADARFVFTYSTYTDPGIALACKKTNAKLIEVQHGVVLRDTIYYQSALDKTALEKGLLLMPYAIATFGSEWRNIIIEQRSFFDHTNTVVLGSSAFDKALEIAQARTRTSLRIVFFSQGRRYKNVNNISDFIEAFIGKYGAQLAKLTIEVVLRPHPSDADEFMQLRDNYAGSALIVEDLSKISAMQSIANADILFAASSMALYEATALGKIAISLDRFSGIIDATHIKLVKSADELFDFIEQYAVERVPQNQIPYLESFDPDSLNKLIASGLE